MSDFQLIEATVRKAGRRIRWQRAWRGFWHGFLVGTGVFLLALGLYKVLPVPDTLIPVAAAIGLVCAAVGFAAGSWRSDSLPTVAFWLDQRQRLRERLTAALEFGQDPTAGEWGELLVKQAAKVAAEQNVRGILPYHLPKASRWALLVLALTAGLGLVPEYRSKEYAQKQRDKEVVREVGRQLAELTRRSLERRKPALEATKETVKSVGELGGQLARSPVPRPEALRELAKITEKVQQEAKDLVKPPGLKALERASRAAGRNSPADADALRKQMDALQKSLGNKEANADALDKLQKEIQKTKQAAANLMSKDAKIASAAQDSLAQALSELAKTAQDMGASLPSLEEAIGALQAGKIDQVLKDLNVAEKDLEKIKDLAQSLKQMQQQMAQMGKNLAEQLKNGQVEAAQSTLSKMVSQLKSGNLTPEQLKAMMDEVAAAQDPAAVYSAKVADLLKQSVKQMGQGDKPGAAQSLAEAAKELENMMQQLADAQDLKGVIDSLKKAQFCVGNGASWALCQGPPRAGKGSKPGRGVGTWAEESGWTDIPEQTDAWDNSNVQRPDMDARGQTDRGEGDLPEGLVPTKVKGQFSPGGPMPSITLKGVSIKGQSTVAVQEAITAAQSAAQSALSQDQVPRAYQGAVKDYFDDIKK